MALVATEPVPARPEGRRRGLGPLATVLLLCVVVPLATFLVGAWLAGWRLQHVSTPSMEPTYPVGSLVVSDPVDPSEVDVGNVITFVDPGDRGRTVTHRVVEVQASPDDGLSFVTRGDNNPDVDREPVPARNVQSRVRWAVPALGSWLAQVQSPAGVAVLLGLPLLVLVVGEVRDRRGGGRARLDATCGACTVAIGSDDRYCRRCGARQQPRPPDARER